MANETMQQSGAIPVYQGRVFMVTSRNGRRWVFPKGQIDPGHTPREAALIEAWEEAGLVGSLDPEPVGSYLYEKYGVSHHVMLYQMRVSEIRDVWPERGFRDRELLTVDEAIERVEEPSLRELLKRLFPGRRSDLASFANA